MKLVTAATMREMDRRTIEEFHIPGIVLMENAALRVVEAIIERYGSLAGKRVVVLCGKGNNGGDGFAIARHLAVRYRSVVDVFTIFDPESVSGDGDAAVNLRMALSSEEMVRQYVDERCGDFDQALGAADFIVDALFGTGFRGAIKSLAAKMVESCNNARQEARLFTPESEVRRRVIAVDIPSGVNADTGAVDGPAIHADLTITFGLAKPGLIGYPGAANVGELVVADICMPLAVVDDASAFAETTESVDVAQWLPSRENSRDANKGKFGHVLVIAGSRGFLGAASMSAHAAARTGAGLVTLAVPESLLQAAMSTVNPVIMTRGLPETKAGTFAKSAVDAVLDLCKKATAVAIGPGLGAEVDETAEFVREIVRRCPVPMVIDADALNTLASDSDHGAAIVSARGIGTVLTPHPGEMGRLSGKSTADVQADRFGIVMDASDRYRCTVLLKGSRTLISSPDETVNINMTGNAGMASGGMGDVLTGVIGALLGMGLKPHAAATAGAYIHGVAGDIAAKALGGKGGLIATDVIDHLPAALGGIVG